MSDNIEPCTVGILLNKALDCHKLSYCRKSLLIILSEVSDLELKLIQKRADVVVSAADTICTHHAKIYLEKFEEHQRKCCDPFSMHDTGVKFFFVPSSKVDEHHCLLQERFESHSTVPGTRDNHWFVPLSKTELKIGKVSGDDDSWIYCTTAKCKSSASGETEYKFEVGQYVACLYDQKWYIGIALKDGEEDDEFQVKFMLPNGPSNYFQWPCKDDVCWVPKSHLLCTIPAPTTTSLGRQYQISQDTTSLVSTLAETRQRRLQQKS